MVIIWRGNEKVILTLYGLPNVSESIEMVWAYGKNA